MFLVCRVFLERFKILYWFVDGFIALMYGLVFFRTELMEILGTPRTIEILKI